MSLSRVSERKGPLFSGLSHRKRWGAFLHRGRFSGVPPPGAGLGTRFGPTACSRPSCPRLCHRGDAPPRLCEDPCTKHEERRSTRDPLPGPSLGSPHVLTTELKPLSSRAPSPRGRACFCSRVELLTVGAEIIHQDDLLQQPRGRPVDDAGDGPLYNGQSFVHEYEDDTERWQLWGIGLLKAPTRHHLS